MIIEYKFTTQDGREIEGMRTELDRNYPDEEQALVLIADDESDTGGYFELNLRKDEAGRLTGGGYMAEYDSEDDSEPAYINTDIMLDVTEHDFDETLRKANETLRPFGKRIVADYDGEGYWAIASTDMDGSNPDYYAEGDFEHEVQGDINECLVHVLARVKNPEQCKEPMEKYKVTIIFGEYAAKAYCNGGVEEMAEHMSEGQLTVREFDTEAERRAYIMGIDDSDGWLGAAVLSKEDAESETVKQLLDE